MKNFFLLLLTGITLFLSSQTYSQIEFIITKNEETCAPVIPLKFYLMDASYIDPVLAKKIQVEVKKLNTAFDGQIKFQLIGITHNKSHEFLHDIRKAALETESKSIDSLFSNIESNNTVNIFICKSFKDENKNYLNGITPKLVSNFKIYEVVRPTFERIYISYSSLSKIDNTLIHEFGHYLNIDHPSNLTESLRVKLNLIDDIASNHMTYGSNFKNGKFTDEQILKMKQHLIQYRAYIIKKTDCSKNLLTMNE